MTMLPDEERTVSLSAFEAGSVVTLIERCAHRFVGTMQGELVVEQLWQAYRKINSVFTETDVCE